jgi:hypothetical protein
VTVTGTQCNSITHTVNTLGPSSFSPGQLTNSFADATGTDEAGAWWYDRAGLTDGYFRSSKGIAIPNSRPLTAVKFAGGNNKVRIVQLDVNDAIRICVNGDAITAIGAVASLSGLSNGDLTVQGTGRFEGLTASKVVITDASKNLSTIGYATAATVSTLVERDGSGNINVVGLNASGLTASQAVVTDGSKNLASLAYATAATADTIAKRTSAGCVVAAPQVATYTPGSTSFSVSGLGPTVVCFVSNSGATTINDITGGVAGTIVTMVFADANTTIDRSLNFTLDGAADFAATQYDTITLIKQASGNFWSEISRAVNG